MKVNVFVKTKQYFNELSRILLILAFVLRVDVNYYGQAFCLLLLFRVLFEFILEFCLVLLLWQYFSVNIFVLWMELLLRY